MTLEEFLKIGLVLIAGPIFFSIFQLNFVARFVFKSGQKVGFGQFCFDIFKKNFENLLKKWFVATFSGHMATFKNKSGQSAALYIVLISGFEHYDAHFYTFFYKLILKKIIK
uniref:Uncharacterized protein n=1 Tax=Siphoviridae sp. ct9lR64 TaxID=2826178 RepID=A0A8S5QYJ6_9CAUD|nr:MAG TPA: hypothetical protein [Siphoviridae sp. ct9lR64]